MFLHEKELPIAQETSPWLHRRIVPPSIDESRYLLAFSSQFGSEKSFCERNSHLPSVYHILVQRGCARFGLLGKVQSEQERPFMVGAPPDRRHKHLPLNHPLWLVGSSAAVLSTQVPSQREFVQADVLDGGPDDRQATG